MRQPCSSGFGLSWQGARPRIRAPRRVAAVLAAVLTAASSSPATGAAAAGEDLAGQRVALTHRIEILQRQLALGSGDRFVLVLDQGRERLLLTFRGAVLEQCPVGSAELGLRRIAFRTAPAPRWCGGDWSDGIIEPARVIERREIVAPKPGVDEPAEVEVPPTPEESCPAPERFEIRFGGGLAVEISAEGTTAPAGAWRRAANRLRWGIRALLSPSRPSSGGLVRIRLTVPPDRIGPLYRALPDGMDFLVIPPPVSLTPRG